MQRELERQKEKERALKKPEDFVPNSNYREKYEHLIGREAAKEAARKTQTNKQYGFGMFFSLFYLYVYVPYSKIFAIWHLDNQKAVVTGIFSYAPLQLNIQVTMMFLKLSRIFSIFLESFHSLLLSPPL
jgi:hypothetical protein